MDDLCTVIHINSLRWGISKLQLVQLFPCLPYFTVKYREYRIIPNHVQLTNSLDARTRSKLPSEVILGPPKRSANSL